ncbi:hypothetical protein CC2G_011162 [Coprinopsis cinerea AmutBmut pab1-1]|nr:hypothetical protein CC2G_011162 [Coprinopsis cinerea AmutBmut pab1-1]
MDSPSILRINATVLALSKRQGLAHPIVTTNFILRFGISAPLSNDQSLYTANSERLSALQHFKEAQHLLTPVLDIPHTSSHSGAIHAGSSHFKCIPTFIPQVTTAPLEGRPLSIRPSAIPNVISPRFQPHMYDPGDSLICRGLVPFCHWGVAWRGTFRANDSDTGRFAFPSSSERSGWHTSCPGILNLLLIDGGGRSQDMIHIGYPFTDRSLHPRMKIIDGYHAIIDAQSQRDAFEVEGNIMSWHELEPCEGHDRSPSITRATIPPYLPIASVITPSQSHTFSFITRSWYERLHPKSPMVVYVGLKCAESGGCKSPNPGNPSRFVAKGAGEMERGIWVSLNLVRKIGTLEVRFGLSFCFCSTSDRREKQIEALGGVSATGERGQYQNFLPISTSFPDPNFWAESSNKMSGAEQATVSKLRPKPIAL